MTYMSDSYLVNIQPGLVMTDDTPHLAAGMLACIINGLNAVLASECWLEVVIIRFLAQPSPALATSRQLSPSLHTSASRGLANRGQSTSSHLTSLSSYTPQADGTIASNTLSL